MPRRKKAPERASEVSTRILVNFGRQKSQEHPSVHPCRPCHPPIRWFTTMSSTSQLQSATGATGSHHHPPLSSLVHPHLHTILHIAQDHGLPSPQWTATTPDEKRSLSSDKTITPSSTMKTPQASLQVPSGVPQPNTPIASASIEDVTAGMAHLGRSATGSSPLAFSSSPDSHGWSSEQHHQQTWSTSPATEKFQQRGSCRRQRY